MNKTVKKLLGDKDYLGRRYTVFLLGLVVCAFGVAFTVKAGLGNSPVTCVPYSLSLVIPGLTLGNWLFIFCIAQVILQIILLRKKCVASEMIIQIILGLVFGYVTDAALFVLSGVAPEHYAARIILLLAGCAILAFGVYLELLGNVVMLSGDAYIAAIAGVTGQTYSKTKIILDVSMCIAAFVICLVCLGRLEGAREGTVIAAVLVGPMIKLYRNAFKKPASYIIPSEE